MDTNLHGKNAVVCGSTAGIGRAAAFELAALGAGVTLIARSEDKLRLTCAELPRPGGDAQRHAFAVADFGHVASVAEAARGVASERPHQILVNNTGGPAGGPVESATPEQFLAAFSAHLVANQLLTQAIVPAMKAAKFGRIVNVISTSVKAPIPGLGVSNTIRGAVASWAKTLAGELAPHGITVNNVLPGFTATDRLTQLFSARASKAGTTLEQETAAAIGTIPAGRLGKAEEIAAGIAFLCTPAAAYINGINLPIDGGRLPTL
jgi:3-oxoacyl-[acyl-carrier protein] reductase